MGKLTYCRLCKHKDFTKIIDLGLQSLTGVFRKDLLEVPKYPLELVKCKCCELVQLSHSVDPRLLYGETYGYRSGLNQGMVSHLKSLAETLKTYLFSSYRPLKKGDLVLDIGSNDGTFLGCFENYLDLVGVDPLAPKFSRFYRPDIKIIPDFFTGYNLFKAGVTRKARLITSIAMLYDLEDPVQFAKEVANTLAPDGLWLFEQSYLPTMLERVAFDTICHEHLEYYSLKQLKMIVEGAGLVLHKAWLTETNGGSIAVIAGHGENSLSFNELEKKEVSLEKTYKKFASSVTDAKAQLILMIKSLNTQGKKVFGYGASTKGNVILQYCGFTNRDIPLIADVNEEKVGAFTPGTGIQIVSEETARKMKPDYFLVLPYHFKQGILQREKEFLAQGGGLIFPLPNRPTLVKSEVGGN